jgi:hypothetical protein
LDGSLKSVLHHSKFQLKAREIGYTSLASFLNDVKRYNASKVESEIENQHGIQNKESIIRHIFEKNNVKYCDKFTKQDVDSDLIGDLQNIIYSSLTQEQRLNFKDCIPASLREMGREHLESADLIKNQKKDIPRECGELAFTQWVTLFFRRGTHRNINYALFPKENLLIFFTNPARITKRITLDSTMNLHHVDYIQEISNNLFALIYEYKNIVYFYDLSQKKYLSSTLQLPCKYYKKLKPYFSLDQDGSLMLRTRNNDDTIIVYKSLNMVDEKEQQCNGQVEKFLDSAAPEVMELKKRILLEMYAGHPKTNLQPWWKKILNSFFRIFLRKNNENGPYISYFARLRKQCHNLKPRLEPYKRRVEAGVRRLIRYLAS